jgi:transposase InsO family protein
MQICGRKAVWGGKSPEPVARTAEQPGQTINVDLCFVPEEHAGQEKLPAVSGSSGHLVVERVHTGSEEAHWPGQVFAEAGLDYAEAMHQYARDTRDRLAPHQTERTPTIEEKALWRTEYEGRAERYRIREQRKREELAWKETKAEWRHARQAYRALSRLEQNEQQAAYQLACQAWKKARQQHHETLNQQSQEDQVWHQHNQELKAASAENTPERSWIAILVTTDNCTRQCLGLPIFRTGAMVTSDELVAALLPLLPPELEFLISDQGTHFRSKAFANLAKKEDFIHVPVYRHRPESNGIAERFVLTLKDWLHDKSWKGPDALLPLLASFQSEYNDRPHQGLAISGLSPNEFAQRIWLM